MDTKSRPQRVNSYKLNLFNTDTAVIRWIPNPDQVNLHRVNPVWLLSYARWLQKPVAVYQMTICKRCTGEHNQLFKAWITTDSLKFFCITFCTVVTVYCTCKIAKDAFKIVHYVTTFYMQHCLQHCAVACFVLKRWFFHDCRYVADMYNVVCYKKTMSSLSCDQLINLNAVERRV